MTSFVPTPTPLTLSCSAPSAINSSVPSLVLNQIAQLEPAAKRHTVYNFEVEGTHTYIAGGIRVHNTSVLSLLKDEELVKIDGSTLSDTNGDGSFDYVEIDSYENGLKAGSTVYKQVNVDGEDQVEIYKTYTDGQGRLVQLKTVRDANGVISETPVVLTGAEFGEKAGQLITPYLTAAIIGDDASAFESIAVNTILGTFVENIFEFAGGHIHDQIASGGLQNNGLDAIADHTFDDILIDLGANAVSYSSQQLTSWIMAEVYGGLATDSLGGELYASLVTQGVDYVVDAGLHTIAVDVFGMDAGLVNDLGLEGFNPNQLPGILSVDGIGTLVFEAVFDRMLPQIETMQGQIAAGLTTLALETFNLLQTGLTVFNFNPVTFVIGRVIGKIFDELYDTDPQAFTNVVYNDETGLFEVGNSWSEDGGDVAIGQQLANSYAGFMNDLIAQTQSQSNNLSELGETMKLVFGHYEEEIRNGSGRNFDTMDAAIKSRVIDTLQELELNDGDLKVRDAINDVVEMADMLDNINFTGSYSYWKKFLGIKLDKKTVYTEINEDPESTNAELIAFVSGTSINANNFKAGVLASLNSIYRDITLSDLDDTHDATRIIDRLTSRSWRSNLETMIEASKSTVIDRVGDALYMRAIILKLEEEGYTVDTKAQLIAALEDSALSVKSDEALYAQLNYNMQIAAEYQEYLDNKSAYDAAIIAAGEDSGFAQGWALTFMEAERLGLTKAYTADGDEIDNVFITSGGDDVINGADGDDVIRTYSGDDTITGGTGDDMIRAGEGNDIIDAGDGRDVVDAGDGDDTVTLGAGEDIIQLGGAGQTTVTDFDPTEDSIGIAFGTDLSEIVIASAAGGTMVTFGETTLLLDGVSAATLEELNPIILGTDAADVFDFSGTTEAQEVVALGGNDTFIGGSGDDWFSGGRGGDTYHISLGGGVDTIADREPGRTADGTNFDRIKFGEGIAVEDIRLNVTGNYLNIGVLVGGALQTIAMVEDWDTSAGRMEIFEFANGIEINVFDLVVGAEDYSLGGDWIIGTDEADVIDAEEGNDVVLGFGGDDHLTGSEGDDFLKGGDGTDTLFGSEGDDILSGGAGDGDVLRGGKGNDTFLFETGMGADIIDEVYFADVDTNGVVYGSDNVEERAYDGKDSSWAWFDSTTGHRLQNWMHINAQGEFEIPVSTVVFSDDINITDLALTGGTGGRGPIVRGSEADDPLRQILLETYEGGVATGDSFLVKLFTYAYMDSFIFRDGFELGFEQNGGFTGTSGADSIQVTPVSSHAKQTDRIWVNGLDGDDVVDIDTVKGDIIIGGAGNDIMSGRSNSSYNDFINGNTANVTGDQFIFASDHGHDIIERFLPEIDQLIFDIDGMTRADILYEQVGADIVITYDDDDTITLVNVDVTSITSSVFVIV